MFTACRKPGCKSKGKREFQGYCAKHKAESGWFRVERDSGNRHERGYGSDWEKLREQVLERDDYLCCSCNVKGIITPATTVDHIKAKAHGGTDDLSNLQSLCNKCHNAKTATERLG